MLRPVVGAHLGDPNGSQVGDVIDVDDAVAEAYVLYRWAELVGKKASPTPPKVETATAPEGETATAPSPEESSVMKRGPGRPRKGQ